MDAHLFQFGTCQADFPAIRSMKESEKRLSQSCGPDWAVGRYMLAVHLDDTVQKGTIPPPIMMHARARLSFVQSTDLLLRSYDPS